MNSETLREDGFADFHPLTELALQNIPNGEGYVFALVDTTLPEKSSSDILYIGRAKNPVKKVFGGYIGGSGGKTITKIHKALFNNNYIEKISISWLESKDPKATQSELLEKFRSAHGEYPPWNASKRESAKARSEQKPTKSQKTRKPPTHDSQMSQ